MSTADQDRPTELLGLAERLADALSDARCCASWRETGHRNDEKQTTLDRMAREADAVLDAFEKFREAHHSGDLEGES